jgi:predicted CopG family antitoxin
MTTTINISEELAEELKSRKMYEKESDEEVIWGLLEDTMELSEQAKRNIAISIKEIKQGKVISHEQIKKKLGL